MIQMAISPSARGETGFFSLFQSLWEQGFRDGLGRTVMPWATTTNSRRMHGQKAFPCTTTSAIIGKR